MTSASADFEVVDSAGATRDLQYTGVGIVVVGLLIFVDVQLPFVGNSNILLAFLVAPLLVLSASQVRTPFTAAMAVLLPLYFLIPVLVHQDLDLVQTGKVLVFSMLSVGGMVFLARALAEPRHRRRLIDVLILLALASAALATLQRFGFVGPLGRDRWGYSTTETGELRGAGFLADPNFLALLLASVVPLAVNWRLTQLRIPVLIALGVGLYSTNSRAGLLFAVLALFASILVKRSAALTSVSSRGRKAILIAGAVLLALFIFNVGGQRSRVLQALLIEAGYPVSVGGYSTTDDIYVATERRRLLLSWVDLGLDNLPFGIGSGAHTDLSKAAHNTFATLLAEGGVIGVAISVALLLCAVTFVRYRSDPFAIMGAVIILGGAALSYPGSIFLVIPMGLADGVLASRLGQRPRRQPKPPPPLRGKARSPHDAEVTKKR